MLKNLALSVLSLLLIIGVISCKKEDSSIKDTQGFKFKGNTFSTNTAGYDSEFYFTEVIDSTVTRDTLFEDELATLCNGEVVDTIFGAAAFRTSGFFEDQYVCVYTDFDTSFTSATTYANDTIFRNFYLWELEFSSSDASVKIALFEEGKNGIISDINSTRIYNLDDGSDSLYALIDIPTTDSDTLRTGEVIIRNFTEGNIDITYTINDGTDVLTGSYEGTISKNE